MVSTPMIQHHHQRGFRDRGILCSCECFVMSAPNPGPGNAPSLPGPHVMAWVHTASPVRDQAVGGVGTSLPLPKSGKVPPLMFADLQGTGEPSRLWNMECYRAGSSERLMSSWLSLRGSQPSDPQGQARAGRNPNSIAALWRNDALTIGRLDPRHACQSQ